MATKDCDSCLIKCAPSEPIFVLRAQDLTAPGIIMDWIKANPQISKEKRQEAEATILAMREWHTKKSAD